MLRVSFTLFNLQGTRSTAFQLSVRYILAHSFSLVKHFFQKFFTSYSAALSFKLVRSRRGTRLFYHTLSSLSRTFFKFFSRFSTSNHSISVLFQRLPLSRANSFSLPHASHFVKHFFQVPFEVHPASAWFLLTFRLVSVPSREALR